MSYHSGGFVPPQRLAYEVKTVAIIADDVSKLAEAIEKAGNTLGLDGWFLLGVNSADPSGHVATFRRPISGMEAKRRREASDPDRPAVADAKAAISGMSAAVSELDSALDRARRLLRC